MYLNRIWQLLLFGQLYKCFTVLFHQSKHFKLNYGSCLCFIRLYFTYILWYFINFHFIMTILSNTIGAVMVVIVS